MTADTESFEERLQRIADARTVAAIPAGEDIDLPQPGPGLLRRGLVGLLGIAALIVLASSLQPMLMANTSSADGGATSFLAGLLDTRTGGADSRPAEPIAYLPAAPEGWMRFTALDAQVPGAMTVIAAAWPADGGLRLDDHPGSKTLKRFVTDQSRPGAKAKTTATAIYLDPKGHFLRLNLTFQDETAALGAADDQAAWIVALTAQVDITLDSGQIVERNRLAGVEITNKTRPAGKSRAVRPIADKLDLANTLDIAAPLTHRVVVRIDGTAPPRDAETLIAGIDRGGLHALLP